MTYVGSQVEHTAAQQRRRARLISIAFFAGIVLSLLILGTLAAMLGRLLAGWSSAFAIGTAILSVAAGSAALFAPALQRRFRDPVVPRRGGILGAFAYGLLYTVASITTSAGPLMLLLTIAAAVGKPAYGAALSFGYALGRGLPFLLLGFLAGGVSGLLSRLTRWRRPAEVASGLALIGVGVYFFRLVYLLA